MGRVGWGMLPGWLLEHHANSLSLAKELSIKGWNLLVGKSLNVTLINLCVTNKQY